MAAQVRDFECWSRGRCRVAANGGVSTEYLENFERRDPVKKKM